MMEDISVSILSLFLSLEVLVLQWLLIFMAHENMINYPMIFTSKNQSKFHMQNLQCIL